MATTKKENPVINPGDALRSLQGYSESVVALVSLCDNIKKLLDPDIKKMLDSNLDEVKKYYK